MTSAFTSTSKTLPHGAGHSRQRSNVSEDLLPYLRNWQLPRGANFRFARDTDMAESDATSKGGHWMKSDEEMLEDHF